MTPTDTRNWQMSLADPQAIVEGLDDITQCVYIILTTIPGSDPLRPTFGSNVYQYLDKPLETVRARIIYAVAEAIGQWEKRIEVTGCSVTRNADKTTITIEGIIVASAKQITITSTL